MKENLGSTVPTASFVEILDTSGRTRVLFVGERDTSRFDLGLQDVSFRFFDIAIGCPCARVGIGGNNLCIPENGINVSGRFYLETGEEKIYSKQDVDEMSDRKKTTVMSRIMKNLDCAMLYTPDVSSGKYYPFAEGDCVLGRL